MPIAIKELGHIVLYVSDLDRSVAFYHELLGFPLVLRQGNFALFSGGRTHHEMLLIEIGGKSAGKSRPESGLYHIGFKIGENDAQLKDALMTLEAAGVTIVGTADHTVTHSLYILDPDGNELEIYVDVSDEWCTNPEAILSPTRPLSL